MIYYLGYDKRDKFGFPTVSRQLKVIFIAIPYVRTQRFSNTNNSFLRCFQYSHVFLDRVTALKSLFSTMVAKGCNKHIFYLRNFSGIFKRNLMLLKISIRHTIFSRHT